MQRQINYKTMRTVVAIIALSIAPVVHLLADSINPLKSISISYWTNAHDIFVGALVAISFFLFAYNGSEGKMDLEFYLSKFACVFALIVALFPTQGFDGRDIPASWTTAIADTLGLTTGVIHFIAAALLFICLIMLMWFFSNNAMRKGCRGRAMFYRAICVLMISGMVLFYIAGRTLEFPNYLFWLEAWGLTFFGIGWLRARTYKPSAA